MSTKLPIGVLVSGGGTNLQALIDACAHPDFPARIALVVSNLPGVGALERATRAGIPHAVVPHRSFGDRASFEAAVVEQLRGVGVELVCLAGFMRIIGTTFLHAFPGRIINIHPALLPAFPGMHGARQALEYGVKVAGCTVHFVDEGTDTGPIIAQATVPVLDSDDEATLAARILVQEHRLYPLAVRLIAEGKITVDGRRVRTSTPATTGALVNPSPDR